MGYHINLYIILRCHGIKKSEIARFPGVQKGGGDVGLFR
jgi:hypothetical protein